MPEYVIPVAVKLIVDTPTAPTRAQRRALRLAVARAANGARWHDDTAAVDVAAILGHPPIGGSCYFAPTDESDN